MQRIKDTNLWYEDKWFEDTSPNRAMDTHQFTIFESEDADEMDYVAIINKYFIYSGGECINESDAELVEGDEMYLKYSGDLD